MVVLDEIRVAATLHPPGRITETVQPVVAQIGVRLNKVIAEYALRDVKKPIGVSEYRLTESIPRSLKGKLPTVQELEEELESGFSKASPIHVQKKKKNRNG